MSIIIGLTGQTGAGKGTAASLLCDRGMSVIDCDKVAREITEKGSKTLLELTEAFSDEILNPDGTLNRAALAFRAFSAPQHVRKLNSITHPAIIERTIEKAKSLSENGAKFILLDAPTLLESGAAEHCDVIIAVVADEDTRLERIIKRDSLSLEAAKKRMSAQPKTEFYTDNADYTIYNNGDIASLSEQVDRVFDDIMRNFTE